MIIGKEMEAEAEVEVGVHVEVTPAGTGMTSRGISFSSPVSFLGEKSRSPPPLPMLGGCSVASLSPSMLMSLSLLSSPSWSLSPSSPQWLLGEEVKVGVVAAGGENFEGHLKVNSSLRCGGGRSCTAGERGRAHWVSLCRELGGRGRGNGREEEG